MIIEKKQTKPSIKDVVVPCNYVLVDMEESFSTYQMKGRETNISVSPIIYENGKQIRVDEKLVSPFGKIVKTPMKMVFNGERIKELVDRYNPVRETGRIKPDGDREKVLVNYSALKEINELKRGSLSYHTECEVNVGDRVHVSYLYFLNAKKEGLYVDTQEGEMVMVKYDHLRMVLDENNQPKRMLNGYVLIQPKEYDIDVKEEDGRQFTERESGLVILNPQKVKKTRKNQLGTVVLGGRPLKGYLEEPNKVDRNIELNIGTRILYDPRFALKVENDLHQIISEKDLYLIRRDGILLTEHEVDNFDKIEI